MASNSITLTPHLKLSMMPANYHVWAQLMNDNLITVDAAVTGFVAVQNLRGPWTNSTAYAIGDTVVDSVTAVLWISNITHVSSVIPTTFVEERTAFPEHWSVYTTGTPASRMIIKGEIIQMESTDTELVINKTLSEPTTVILPIGSSFGKQARVSDGKGDASVNNILVQAADGGTINGVTGALTMAFDWETTLFRCLGGNAWSII